MEHYKKIWFFRKSNSWYNNFLVVDEKSQTTAGSRNNPCNRSSRIALLKTYIERSLSTVHCCCLEISGLTLQFLLMKQLEHNRSDFIGNQNPHDDVLNSMMDECFGRPLDGNSSCPNLTHWNQNLYHQFLRGLNEQYDGHAWKLLVRV